MICNVATLSILLVCVNDVWAHDHVEATKATTKWVPGCPTGCQGCFRKSITSPLKKECVDDLRKGNRQACEALSGLWCDTAEREGLYPTLHPKSDEAFFGKSGDYLMDKRPKVDVLHFKHPYPVVQDSDDFDKDYVKDENSDDGSFAAQSEYDRLRHKLAKEKADVAKATHHKNAAENELREALKRHDEAKKGAEAAAEAKRRREEVERNKGEEDRSIPGLAKKAAEAIPEILKIPGSMASPGAVKVATSDTEQAMDALEECKRQLAEARNNLKRLMEELQGAKKAQSETQATMDASSSRSKDLATVEEKAHNTVKSEYKEYMDARNAYLTQQALVAKMEQDIQAASSKVKSFRDAEDKDGGVYNDPPTGHRFPKWNSAAHSSVAPLSFALVAAAVVACLAN